MASFRRDDRAADGIPVEVQLENGGYFEAFLMDIINGEALIHFPFGWMPESKYQFSQVRFPPAEETSLYALQEKMIAEVLVNKNQGFHQGWFKCCIQMLKSEFCQFEYLDTQNGSDFGYTCNIRKPNINPTISMDILHVHKIIIPEDLHEYAKCENVHNELKDAMESALVNYDVDRGELVIISRNTADISRAEILEKDYLISLFLKSAKGKLNPKLEIAESDEFTAEFTVPKSYRRLVIGNRKVHIRTAKNIDGISNVQLIKKLNKFIIHGKTEEAVKEARELLELKIESYPVLEKLMSDLVGSKSASIREIIRATGAADISVEHITHALERNEETKELSLYIIGNTEAIKRAKMCIQFQIDMVNEIQLLREELLAIERQIAIFVRTDSRSESVIFTYPETVQSTRQIESSTNLPTCSLVELEELQKLNELLLEDYRTDVDLDIILKNIKTRDLEDNTTKDTNPQSNTTTDINLENNTTKDINLDDINKEDPDLGANTTRLNVSMGSNQDSSNVLDTQEAVSNTDILPIQNCDYLVMRPPKEVEKVESVGVQFVEDSDFCTRDTYNTSSKPTCQILIKEQVIKELDEVISEAVTYTEQIDYESQDIHLEENLPNNSTTVFSGDLKDVRETSSQEESIQSQNDDQEPDCFLSVDDAPKDLDCIDASENKSSEGQDIPLSF